MMTNRRGWLVSLALGLMTLLLVPFPAAAQGGGDSEASATEDDAELIQILDVEDDGETVVLDVAVPSTGDEALPDKSVFGLAYNGDAIENFQLNGVSSGVDVIIVVDTSGSMTPTAMIAARQAATTLVDRLPDNARVGVIGFSDTVTVLNEPTSDHSVARSNINSLSAGGDTALWDGLVEASRQGTNTNGILPYVVVLSDGANDGGVAGQQEAIDVLEASGSALYAVFIDSPSADGTELQEAVESLNGIYVEADSGELQTAYERIADRLAGRYQLTFARPNIRTARVTVSVVVDNTLAFAQVVLDGEREDSGATTDPEGPARVLNVPAESQLGVVPARSPGLLGAPIMLPLGAAAMFLAMILMGALIINPAMDVRLEAAARADQVAGLKGKLSTAADQLVARRDEEGELNKALDAAGLHLRPGEFVLMTTVIVVVVSLLGWLIGGLLLGVIVAGLGSLCCLLYLNRRADKQRELFADQLTDTLNVMGGSLRAGRGLPQAIELVGHEAPSPTAEQFRRIGFEVQVGRDMTESMLAVAERMKSQDFEWVARAVAINRELGGDLTELLDTIANTIRERRRVARMVTAITAEGRASGWVLLALPFVVFAFASWRTPDAAELMFTTGLGRAMLIISLMMMVVGYIWIRKIVNFKY